LKKFLCYLCFWQHKQVDIFEWLCKFVYPYSKGFIPLMGGRGGRGGGGLYLNKNRKSKVSWHCSFKKINRLKHHTRGKGRGRIIRQQCRAAACLCVGIFYRGSYTQLWQRYSLASTIHIFIGEKSDRWNEKYNGGVRIILATIKKKVSLYVLE
jgi:hypothetical protein